MSAISNHASCEHLKNAPHFILLALARLRQGYCPDAAAAPARMAHWSDYSLPGPGDCPGQPLRTGLRGMALVMSTAGAEKPEYGQHLDAAATIGTSFRIS